MRRMHSLRCPRCSSSRLFDGLLSVIDRCPKCDLDLSTYEQGDGPIAFVVLIMGALSVSLMVWIEFTYSPSIIVHLIILPIFIVFGSLALLRYIKALFISLEYKNRREDYEEKD